MQPTRVQPVVAKESSSAAARAPPQKRKSKAARREEALAVAAHGSIDAAVRATQLVLERVDGYSAATWSAPQDVVQPGNASFAEALKSVQQRAAKLFGK